MNSELIEQLTRSRKRLAESLKLLPPSSEGIRGRRMRRRGFLLQRARFGQAHLRTLQADAQPGERKRRRHRRGRVRAGTTRRQPGGSGRPLHASRRVPRRRGPEIEKEFIKPFFDVAASAQLDKVADWKSVPGLEVSRRMSAVTLSASSRKYWASPSPGTICKRSTTARQRTNSSARTAST